MAAMKSSLKLSRETSDCLLICPPTQPEISSQRKKMTTEIEVNDVVKYSRPQNEEEGKIRFRVLEIHRDVENPRAHIQLICDWRIKPVEVVALAEIEPVAH
jgi:hypothetical protein